MLDKEKANPANKMKVAMNLVTTDICEIELHLVEGLLRSSAYVSAVDLAWYST